MKILDTTINISKSRKGFYMTNLFGEWSQIPESEYDGVNKIYRIMMVKALRDETKKEYISNVCKKYGYGKLLAQLEMKPVFMVDNKIIGENCAPIESETTTEENTVDKVNAVKVILEKLVNFFTEFEFEPNFRFVNTLFRNASKSTIAAKNYIMNYFKLIDSPNVTPISEKMRCQEFNDMLDAMKIIGTDKKINSRFKLYYGSQGTGKTTQGMKESGGKCMVCHSAMLPSDLMEDFKFEDGKAAFTPSALQNAIVNGEVIVLDEINLLPFESLRFLQSILDGKASFQYKGNTINIKDGFKIIGTMNLQVNGSIYSLPEPLVDRCEEIKEYKLTAENLVRAVI